MESNAEPSESGGMVALVSFVSSGDAAEDEPTRHLFLSARRPNAGLYLQDLSSRVKDTSPGGRLNHGWTRMDTDSQRLERTELFPLTRPLTRPEGHHRMGRRFPGKISRIEPLNRSRRRESALILCPASKQLRRLTSAATRYMERVAFRPGEGNLCVTSAWSQCQVTRF